MTTVTDPVKDTAADSARAQELDRFGVRVRQLREAAGLRQADLAGLDHIAISNIERGLRDVGLVRAAAIACALGVHPEVLLSDD
ncbi:helix-turn-helix domain-containing protein [Geodermatophilus sp. URMC 63]